MIDGNNELENHIYYVCLINVILFLIGVFAAYGVYYEYLYEGIFTNGISDFKRLIIFNFICYLLVVYNAAVIIMAMGEGLLLSARYRKFNKSKKLGLKIITSAVINHDKDFLLKNRIRILVFICLLIGVGAGINKIFEISNMTVFEQLSLISEINDDIEYDDPISIETDSIELYDNRNIWVENSDGVNVKRSLKSSQVETIKGDNGFQKEIPVERHFRISYYKRSGYVKEVLDITDTSDYNLSLSSPSYSYFIKQNIEIRLSVNENNTILVERSGIAVYDDLDPNSVELAEMEKKIYWYITCDGEFYKRSLAIRLNWTNILTFAPAGDYAVTLVLDNDEEIEDQAPISNTILYSKRSKNSNSEEYESVPLEKEE